MMECVLVCKDYSDFLAHTLPENMIHFDRMVVVTHPHDKETINLCNKYSIDCVQTTLMHDNGDKFNKSRCINLGLSHLKQTGWIMHLDADILLPHDFKNLFKRAKPHKEKLYGVDRVNARGFEHFMAHKHKLIPHYMHNYFVEPPHEFPLGARIIHKEHGWCPIGYTQIWHSDMHRKYPYHQGSCEHDDLLFSVQWPREDRVLLPEIIVTHLESEHCEMGKNWLGRRTKPFMCCHCGRHPCKCPHRHPYKPRGK